MKATEQKPSGAKKWFLAIGIAIVFVLFVNYGISTFYNQPQYEKYCNRTQEFVIDYTNQTACLAMGGQWTKYPAAENAKPVPAVDGYCDPDFTCRQGYDEANTKFEKNAFVVKVVAGMIALIVGILMTVESVSAGFLLGGILNLFFAMVEYWYRFSDIVRFVLLGFILTILVWLGYKKLK